MNNRHLTPLCSTPEQWVSSAGVDLAGIVPEAPHKVGETKSSGRGVNRAVASRHVLPADKMPLLKNK